MNPTSKPELVRVLKRTNNEIIVEVEADADGILILGEVDFPGWWARVDGRRTDVIRVDYALRGVCVPKGRHQVSINFLPLTLIVGAVISVTAWAVVVWALIRLRVKR